MYARSAPAQYISDIKSMDRGARRNADQLLTRIDVPRRLRRAILLNDLVLVKRIIRNNPKYLLNPDFEDKSNTNLHLAARHGFTQIAVRFYVVLHSNGGDAD
jgi:hypothetical protein